MKRYAIKSLSVICAVLLCLAALFPTVYGAGEQSAVYLRGTFNGWENPAEYTMTEDNNDHYLITIHLKKGYYEFKAATQDWSTFAAPAQGNENITLNEDSDVTFVADKKSKSVLAYPHSSLETEMLRVILKSKWMEHSDLVLIQKNDSVSYESAGESYPETAFWNIISDGAGAYYLQNDATGQYAALSSDDVVCVDGTNSGNTKWKIDTSTGGARFISASDGRSVINIEGLSGNAKADERPIYYTSSQWSFERDGYRYILKPDRVLDTGFSAYANSPSSITSYASGEKRVWNQSEDLSAYPKFTAENSPLAAAVYNLTLEEAVKSINTDTFGEVFYTGTAWQKVWTRDTALSNLYSLAWVFPEISYNCEREKIKTSLGVSVFEQDTGTGGSYPVSTDKIITMLSVWETYLADGDKEHLDYFYDVCRNTIMQDMEVAFDREAGLFRGETCGLDWRDQTYPDWTSEVYDSGLSVIAESKTTSVNAIYCRVLDIMSKAAKVLEKGEEAEQYWAKMAKDLEEKISGRLWDEKLGLYSAWEYPEFMGSVLAEKTDVLGNGFALWFDIGTDEQLNSISKNYPLVTYGADTVYPQKQGKLKNADKNYHNFGIWPGWESILMVGAGYHNNKALAEEIFNSDIRGAATSLTQKEVINYLTGEGVASDQQLWSIAGTLAGYYRVMFGMNYDEEGITFNPCIPDWMEGPFELSNYAYRGSVLDIKLSGKGDRVSSFKVDGVSKDINTYVFPVDSEGNHTIEIIMENSGAEYVINKGDKNLVVCPEMPELTETNGVLSWDEKSGLTYKLWTGREYIDVSGGSYTCDNSVYGCYSLMAVSPDGVCSELSRPVTVSPERITIEAESGTVSDSGFISNGCVIDRRHQSADLTINVNIPKKSVYLLSAVYNNPGDATSGVSCGVRSVYIDGVDAGTLVFPEVYKEHADQMSTHLALTLDAGEHSVKVFYDTANWYDRNMSVAENHVEYNRFYFDYLGEVQETPVNPTDPTDPTDPTPETEPDTSATGPETTHPDTSAPEPVKPVQPKASISRTKAALKAGAVLTLKVKNGSVKTWSSSNTKVATVKNGKITALKKGTVIITATLKDGKKLKCKVTVKTNPKLSRSAVTVKAEKTVKVTITGKASAVKNVYTNTKTAKIISKKTASVIKVKGLKKGKTTLKVKVNGVVLKLKVRVK